MIPKNDENLKSFWEPSGRTLGDIGWNDPIVCSLKLKQHQLQQIERLQYLGWFRQARKANFLTTNLRSILTTVNSIKKTKQKTK